VRPTTASTAAVDVNNLAGGEASGVQRKQWGVRDREGSLTVHVSGVPDSQTVSTCSEPETARGERLDRRRETSFTRTSEGAAPITSPSDPWDASAASHVSET
jgi:hypothetical protein